MSDIVERLRGHPTRTQTFRPLLDEAAAEIEGLRARIGGMEKAIQDIWDKATPYGPGIVENGESYVDKYIMPAGPLHRAKGRLVSNPAPWPEAPKTVVHGMNILGHEDRTFDKTDIPNPRGNRFG